MDYHNFLRSRRSSRRFKPLSIDKDIIYRILETATFAPSAHNRQPWRFAVITKLEQKIHLGNLLSADFRRDMTENGLDEDKIETRLDQSKKRIENSPVVILISLDMTEMDQHNDSAGRLAQAERTMAVQSIACAGMLLQLAARAEGLDSVWTCSPLFAPAAVQLALDLPETWEPQAMFFIGYSAAPPKTKPLKPLSEVIKLL